MSSTLDVGTADDVQINCSIRKADSESKRKLSEPEDMTCIMRIWHDSGKPLKKTRSSGNTAFDAYTQAKGGGHCELILTPIQRHPSAARSTSRTRISPDDGLQMSRRFQSFGSSGASDKKYRMDQTENKSMGKIKIPISDILVVEKGDSSAHVTNLTTMSNGYFEFTMMNRNGQEILLAFLKANLPGERLVQGLSRSRSDVSHSTASSKSVDVEAFTASRITERIKNETFPERIRRKVGRALKSVEELSSNVADCACSCSTNNVPVAPIPPTIEKRDSPPHDKAYAELINSRSFELMEHESTPPKPKHKIDKFDCGLSVETDPEMDSIL